MFGFHHPPSNAVFSNILRCACGVGGDEDWTLIWRNVIYAPGLRRWRQVKPPIASWEAWTAKWLFLVDMVLDECWNL